MLKIKLEKKSIENKKPKIINIENNAFSSIKFSLIINKKLDDTKKNNNNSYNCLFL